jgi:hypothetical protein
MYILENGIMGVIMTINCLQKIIYIDICHCLWTKIINYNIIGQ